MIILLGAPGAGKGTQADLLVDKFGYVKLSIGDALRRQIKLGSEVGKEVEALVNTGKLVDDDTILKVLKAELSANDPSKVLLDGYPRNINQATTLAAMTQDYPLEMVIHFDLDTSEIVDRITGRRSCGNCGASFHVKFNPPKKTDICDRCGSGLSQRADDTEEKVKIRLGVYEEQTKPVVEYYRKQGLYHRIDASQPVDQVHWQVLSAVDL